MVDCDLCKLVDEDDIKTRFYYKDEIVTIVGCLTHGDGNPIMVFNHHGDATEEERRHGQHIIDTLFEYTSIRKEPTEIFDHEHWHINGAVWKGEPITS